jgi:small subunit ribosomal protein S18
MEREIEPGEDTGPAAEAEQPAAEAEQPAAELEQPAAAAEQPAAAAEQPAAVAEQPAAAARPRAVAAPERGDERRGHRDREGGDDGRQRRRGGGGFGRGRRRACVMCVDKMAFIDYKDFSFLRRFLSDRGRIESRRKSGTCAKHQRALAQAIKRARHLALLPYTAEHVRTGVGSSR